MNKCAAHNGSYTCNLPAGHASKRHETRPYRRFEGGKAVVKVFTFTDAYSPLRVKR